MSEDVTKSQFAKLPFQRKLNEADKALVSMLVKPNTGNTRGAGRNRPMDVPGMTTMSKIASKTAGNINDAKNLFQVLPDMDLAKQILVSAILSPTDLTKRTLIYGLGENQLDSNLTGPMLRLIKEKLETLIKINRMLPEMLEQTLFGAGSYPILVLPTSTIDHVINTNSRPNLESIKDEVDSKGWYRPYGILGHPNKENQYDKSSLESFTLDYAKDIGASVQMESFTVNVETYAKQAGKKVSFPGKVMVSDNFNLLKHPTLLERIRKARTSEIYGSKLTRKNRLKRDASGTNGETVSAEAKSEADQPVPTLNDVENMFYLNRRYKNSPVQHLLTPKQLDKENATHPVVMRVPPEAVVPVHVPGNPRDHVGYFLLLDQSCNLLQINLANDYYNDIRANLGGGQDSASNLLAMVRQGQQGVSGNDFSNQEILEMTQAYGKIVEDDLLNRLRTGALTGNYELSSTDAIKQLMFTRALKNKNTLMLFVPVELMTYIAFDYNEYGVGKSLIEDGKILGSIRAALLFANTMAAIKNATDTQTIRIQLPEDDEDPYGTVDFMLSEHAKINDGGMYPIGMTNPMDMITALQRAGKNVVVEGNTAFPEAKFDVESREGSHKEPNLDLDDRLRHRHIQMFGLTPEIMDSSTEVEFATTVVNQHLMLLKRVVQYQEDFTPFITDFVRSYLINSGPIMEELYELVKANKKYLPKEYKGKAEDFIIDALNVLEVTLPAPDIDRLEDQMKRFETYTESVTKAIDAYIREEMFDATDAEGLVESIATVKAVAIANLQRKWLRENDVLTELDIFGTVEEEGSPLHDMLEENAKYTDNMLKALENFMEKVHDNAMERKVRREMEEQRLQAGGVTVGDVYDATGGAGATNDLTGMGDAGDLGDDLNQDLGLTDIPGDTGDAELDADLNLDGTGDDTGEGNETGEETGEENGDGEGDANLDAELDDSVMDLDPADNLPDDDELTPDEDAQNPDKQK